MVRRLFFLVFWYAAAALATYLVAVLLVTQFNLARIVELGYPVPIGDRIATTLHDIRGMLGLYLPLIGIALAIAWLFTGLVLTRFIQPSAWLYALAGFVGLITLHITMYQVIGINGVAPTRTVPGLLSQGIAGAVGGWLFYALRPGRDAPAKAD